MSERQSYSVSRPLSPPMPSYEPLSSSSNSNSNSSSNPNSYQRNPTAHNPQMAVKRESWRPGQSSTSGSTSSVPTGPSFNSWKDPNQNQGGPSESYIPPNSSTLLSGYGGRDRSKSRSPSISSRSRRDASPSNSSSRGYDRSRELDIDMDSDRNQDRSRASNRDRNRDDVRNSNRDRDFDQAGDNRRRGDFNQSRDFDRDRDRDRGWRRDRKRKSFGSYSGGNNNNGNNFHNHGNHGQGQGQGERSWAAWNQKVAANRQDDDDDDDRDRENDRIRNRRREFDRNNGRNIGNNNNNNDTNNNGDNDYNIDRRDNRDRDRIVDRERRRSPLRSSREERGIDIENQSNNGGNTNNDDRSWSAWKARVEEKEGPNPDINRDQQQPNRDQRQISNIDEQRRNSELENVKKQGFWTGGYQNRNNQNQNQNQNRNHYQQQQADYRNRRFWNGDSDRQSQPQMRRGARRDSPDYGAGSSTRSDRGGGGGGRASPDYSTGTGTGTPSKVDQDRGRRDSPDYAAGSTGRRESSSRRSGRSGRRSPDYGVGGKDQDRSRPSSPQTNERKRAPTSPSINDNEPKRPRDRSPTYSRQNSQSPPPVNRWGKHGRDRSSERGSERDRSPPSAPRSRARPTSSPPPRQLLAQMTPNGRRQPLAPQGEMFMSGPNTNPGSSNGSTGGRAVWNDRHMAREREGPSPQQQRRWGNGRGDRIEIDDTSRNYQNTQQPPPEPPSNGYNNESNDRYNYNNTGYNPQNRPPFPSSQQSPYSSNSVSSVPRASGPPAVDSLPYGSPPPPPSTAHTAQQPTVPSSNISNDNSLSVPPTSMEPSAPIKISFNTSPRKGWKSISPSKSIQKLFEDPSDPSQMEVEAGNQTEDSHREQRPLSPLSTKEPKNTSDKTVFEPPQRATVQASSIAPYIQAAFTSWFEQNMQPPIERFLIHYFGREPSQFELDQVGVLLELRNGPDRVQDRDNNNNRFDGRADDRLATRERERARDYRDREREREDRYNGNGEDRIRDRGRRMSNTAIGGVNDIPVIQSRWTPQTNTISTTTHGPTLTNVLSTDSTPTSIPTQSQLEKLQSLLPFPPPSQISRQSDVPSQEALTPPKQLQPQEDPPAAAKSSSSFTPTTSGELYTLLSHVGEGTYGKVYKARNTDTGLMVALKKIRLEGEKDGFPVTAMREIKLLQNVKQVNVVRLLEIMVSKGSVHMVFEYMDHDLTGLLSHPTLKFSPANIKSLNHQMLNGLSYLHAKNILHRDMKGSNILLNSKGELKLADFGLARLYSKKHLNDYTNRVITLWYRSPELLMGETVYGAEVDMWSAGCIVLEIFVTKPIFQGSDEINQLEVIYGIMGTPKEEQWPGVKELPWYELVKPKEVVESNFKSSFEKWLSPGALELVEGLLHFDPSKRLSAKAAMETPYFVSEEPAMEMPTQLAGMGEHHEMSAKQDRQRRKQMEGR